MALHVAVLFWIIKELVSFHYDQLNETCQETYQILALAAVVVLLLLVGEVMIAVFLTETCGEVPECLIGCEVCCMCLEGAVTMLGRLVLGAFGIYKVVAIFMVSSTRQQVAACRPLYHCSAAVFGVNALMGLGICLMCVATLECISAQGREPEGLDYVPVQEEMPKGLKSGVVVEPV
eukprot:CAMPEP_0175248634 /NCGR_PEP_ID=MMETSP0093-20121207/34235_1 /TAXON_ID=311494 /ORGANISM="Alexandrium monilatum, Strain CCMP3105" /LENGTH=176 /DNA_ID=CAMNT_0016542847 /DNA_START=135 /DNA_END=665 /DNA_ORIENTATION=+